MVLLNLSHYTLGMWWESENIISSPQKSSIKLYSLLSQPLQVMLGDGDLHEEI